MAYPPAPVPINMTDATPQQTTHPNLHNSTAQAVNDTVAVLGPNPAHGYGTVDAAIGVAFNGLVKNIIGGVDNVPTAKGFAIMANSSVVTTNASGQATITFPGGFFTAAPVVVVSGTTTPSVNGLVVVVDGSVSVGGFTISIIYANTDNATPIQGTCRINWIAVGQK